jgi:DNA repair exonuclease SbcCD ATPase subunit
MNNMVTKLSSVAALLGVVGAIGAGFVQYGKVMAKIEELDNRKAVINETVDLSPLEEKISTLEVELIDRINVVEEQIKPVDLTLVFKEIGKVKEQIAMLPKPANTKPIYDALKELEEYAWELEEDIEELSKDVAVVKKENELQNTLIEEVKELGSNPLGG